MLFSDQCEQADLRIVMGKENAEIKAIRQQFVDPVSFAYRQSYDLDKGWGKGIIWVADPAKTNSEHHPDLSKPRVLKLLLAHEFGHVLGIGHVPLTIMDENIVAQLQRSIEAPAYMDKIDGFSQLLICDACERTEHFYLTLDGFKKLMGRAPGGATMGTLRVNELGGHEVWIGESGAGRPPGSTDAISKFAFARPNGADSKFIAAGDLLKAVRRIDGTVATVSHMVSGQVIYGYLRSSSGQEFPAALEYNVWSPRAFQINLLDGGWSTPLVQ